MVPQKDAGCFSKTYIVVAAAAMMLIAARQWAVPDWGLSSVLNSSLLWFI